VTEPVATPTQHASAHPSAFTPPEHAVVGRPGRTRWAVLNAASGVMLRLMPRIPDPVKRLFLRRRTVTVDGNTLDTTLQFMLAAQRSAGVNGLGARRAVAAARSQ